MKWRIVAALPALVVFMDASPALAEIPRTVPLQGKLTNPVGQPLSGTYMITFTVYSDSGQTLWTSAPTPVTVTDGLFAAVLGDASPAWTALAFDQPYTIGIKVGSDPEMTPRIALGAIPYALYARGAGLSLPFAGTVSSATPAFSITNSGTGPAGDFRTVLPGGAGPALHVQTDGGLALRAQAAGTGIAVLGLGTIHGSTGSAAASAAGLRGEATNADGQTYGVFGSTASGAANASGVYGLASSPSGPTNGVWGQTNSTSGGSFGVFGVATASSGTAGGVHGSTASATAQAAGVQGVAAAATANPTYGVTGRTQSTASFAAGVLGTSDNALGVLGRTRSNTGVGVWGEADPLQPAAGIAHGVEGSTASITDQSSGVRGIAIGGAGRVYGVSGLTNSPLADAAGVFGEGHTTGRGYGVLGLSTSPTDGASGVRGQASVLTGQVFGVNGVTMSQASGAAGVKGESTTIADPPAGSPLPVMGVHGITRHSLRSVGVQGNAGGPPPALNARMGVRGSAPTLTFGDRTVGVQGDVSATGITEPFAPAGVRGVIAGDPTEPMKIGILGESVAGSGGNPDGPVPLSVGVWGVTHGDNGAFGVRGDATSGSGTTYGVQGRSQSTSASAAGLRGEGNGASGPGAPQSAALEVRNGAIRVSGGSRPAGTLAVGGDWIALRAFCEDDHQHTIGQMVEVPLSNDLVVSDSIILATVESIVETYYNRSYSVQVLNKQAGSCTFRVTVMGACEAPSDKVVIHYLIVNPAPNGA